MSPAGSLILGSLIFLICLLRLFINDVRTKGLQETVTVFGLVAITAIILLVAAYLIARGIHNG